MVTPDWCKKQTRRPYTDVCDHERVVLLLVEIWPETSIGRTSCEAVETCSPDVNGRYYFQRISPKAVVRLPQFVTSDI